MNYFVVFLMFLFLAISFIVNAVLNLYDLRAYAVSLVSKYPPVESANDSLSITATTNNVFWFVQITDTHISQFEAPDRIADLKHFCEHHLRIIKPDLVIVSGDITDGKTQNRQNSRQYLQEWQAYDNVLRESRVQEFTKWLDIRGNHDTFNVRSLDDDENLFSRFSSQGPTYRQSYMLMHKKPFGTYSFIGMDVCQDPGVKRPHNFFGVMTSKTARIIELFSRRSVASNQTFWFSHYPTSTIVSPGFDLRATIGRSGFAYLCGHLHTLVSRMYGIQPQGFLELELADWRTHRFFRVVGVDHDLVSFVDTQLHTGPPHVMEWPVVLITNPKHAGFLLPHKEPAHRIATSTHIRILVWSDSPLGNVTVYINGQLYGYATPANTGFFISDTTGPLFVLPWKPQLLDLPTGQTAHTIAVVVEDNAGRRRTVSQPFTVDGTPQWSFGRYASFVVHADHTANLRLIFYSLWLFLLIILVMPRLLGNCFIGISRSRNWLPLGLYRLGNCNCLFYPQLFFLCYYVCGPVYLGYLLEDRFGAVFTFGLYVSGTFLPDAITYLLEIVQMLLFIYPFMLALLWRLGHLRLGPPTQRHSDPLDCSCSVSSSPTACNDTVLVQWGSPSLLFALTKFSLLVLLSLSVLQLAFMVWSITLPYGLLATVISPSRLGLLLLSWYTMIAANNAKYIQPIPPPTPMRDSVAESS